MPNKLSQMLRSARTEASPRRTRFANLLKNAGIVFTGNIANAIIGLAYLGVLTRALSLEHFGLYALFVAYIALIGRITSFQTWQALITFGNEASSNSDKPLLFRLLFCGWLLDLGSGAVGYLLAILGVTLFPVLLGLGEEAVLGTLIMGATLLFSWTSTPTALLRIHDRFVPQAVSQNIVSCVQLVCVVVLWQMGEKRVLVYLSVTALNNILGQVGLFLYAMLFAKNQGLLRHRSYDIVGLESRCPGIWRFVFTTKADGLVRALREIDIFVVNALLDTSAAGLYRIARTLTRAMGMVTGPFYQTIYPELTRMVELASAEEIASFLRHASLLLGGLVLGVWAIYLVFGESLLDLGFGDGYVAAYTVSAWCMAGMVVWGFAQPLSPAMMAWRRPQIVLSIHIITSIAYIALLAAGIHIYGLLGAGIAFALFYALWAIAMLFAVRGQLLSHQLAKNASPQPRT